MNFRRISMVLAGILLSAGLVKAEPIKHRFVAHDESGHQLILVDENDPSKNWAVPVTKKARDIQLIGDDQVLMATGAGYNVYNLADGKRVKEVKGFKGVESVRRLANGMTIVAANAKGKILISILDPEDKVRHKFKVNAKNLRLARLTPKGNLLLGANKEIVEVNGKGKILWRKTVEGGKHIYQGIRQPNGNTIISAGYGSFVAEIDKSGKIVKKWGGKPAPEGVVFNFFANFQQLKNGNIVVANWHGHKREDSKKGPQLLEFDKDGKLVWKWHDPKMAGCLHSMIILDGLDTKKLYTDAYGPLKAQEKLDTSKVVYGKLDGKVVATGGGRIFIMDEAGKTIWKYNIRGANLHDCWMLPNGNVLFAGGSMVREVNRKGETVWEYKSKITTGGGAFSCQRLENGNTVIGENSTGRVLEVDKDGKIVFTLQTKWKTRNAHHRMRYARKIANGNYLVCTSGDSHVREYTPKGEIVWQVQEKGIAFTALRLKNGNTLVSWLDRITEYDPKGKVVWNFKNTDIPGVHLHIMAGVQVLENGNLVIGCYDSYGKSKKGNAMIEITREKKMVWRYSKPWSRDRSSMGVQKLDKDGKALANTHR